MSHIEDFATALQVYPSEYVTLEIVNFQRPRDNHINVGETWTFQVTITNRGVLDMRNVKLHIEDSQWSALSQTDIFGNAINFGSYLITAPLNVDAGQSLTTRTFYMRADQATGDQGTANEDLFSVHISNWDANLDSLLQFEAGHSSPPLDQYNRHIHP